MLAALCSVCTAAAPEVSARSAVVMDAASGRCLYEKNADARSLVASTTKIMTALLVCEQCDLQRLVTVPPQAAGVEGSSMGLAAGERLTVEALLYGLMLRSGNDAAVALAVACDGSVSRFAARMNARARALGLENTHFDNPNGLDSEQNYSTARDLAVLTRAALRNEQFRAIVGTKNKTVAGRTLTNHNKLLWRYPGATGVKTGYTKKAGRILVSSAMQNSWEAICVTVSDLDDWRDHARLLDYVFETYTPYTAVQAGERLARVPVFDGAEDGVGVLCAQDLLLPITGGECVSVRVFAPHYAFAPVLCAEAGYAEILLNGAPVGHVALYYETPVAQAARGRK